MRRTAVLAAALLFTGVDAPTAHAAGVSYGVQGQYQPSRTPTLPAPALGGIHLMLHSPQPWWPGAELRQVLEVNVGGAPNLRYDLDVLRRVNAVHYGVGVGTGVAYTTEFVGDSPIPLALYTPVSLANIHGVAGVALGDRVALEGLVRVHFLDGAQFGLRLTYRP